MMKTIFTLFTLASLFFGLGSLALATGLTIKGKVVSFDPKEVKVIEGKTAYLIPRKFILLSQLKENQYLELSLTDEQAQAVKKTPIKN